MASASRYRYFKISLPALTMVKFTRNDNGKMTV